MAWGRPNRPPPGVNPNAGRHGGLWSPFAPSGGVGRSRNAELQEYAMPNGRAPGAFRDFGRSFTRRGWTTPGEASARFGRGLSGAYFAQTALISAAVGVGTIVGQTFAKSAEWGTTGHEEDYAGGAVFGARLGRAQAVGGLVGEGIGGALGSLFGPIGTWAGQFAGGIGGTMVGDYFFKRGAYEAGLKTSFATAGAIAKRKVQFGRGYRDTEEAYTMRQMAVQEMAGSLLNARQYLGNEAYFLHR